MRLPNSAEQLTPRWLTDALVACGIDVEVSSVRASRIGAGRSFTSLVLRLELAYGRSCSGAPQSLIAKLPPESAPERASYERRKADLQELGFYREFAAECPARIPRCYFAGLDERTTPGAHRDSALLLEDLGNAEELEPLVSCAKDRAIQIVRAVAQIDAHFYADSRLAARAWLSDGLEDGYAVKARLFDGLWPAFREFAGDALPAAVDEKHAAIANVISDLPTRIRESGGTLLHGDCWNGNLLFEAHGVAQERPVLIDWGEASWGLSGMDLALFIGASLEPEVRRRHETELLDAYVGELHHSGRFDVSLESVREEYQRGLLCWLSMPVLESGGRVASGAAPNRVYAALERANTERLLAAVLESGALDLLE